MYDSINSGVDEFTEFLLKKMCKAQCGKITNLLSLEMYSVKSIYILQCRTTESTVKKLISRNFCEKVRVKNVKIHFCNFHTLH